MLYHIICDLIPFNVILWYNSYFHMLYHIFHNVIPLFLTVYVHPFTCPSDVHLRPSIHPSSVERRPNADFNMSFVLKNTHILNSTRCTYANIIVRKKNPNRN